ncbi:amino acid permease [Aspergillus luchuensis]|uniref:Amino acid permease n=1 Tax=Aspergillus kawachii TaxID=1069201 RepID=A0A146FFJ6_ASPKA|nr:amino acid permease [Aspergillus luchuensis]
MKDFRGDDDAQLAAMGHKAELNRNFSMLAGGQYHWVADESFLGEMDAPSFVDYRLGERDWLVIWSLTGFTIICITLLACASPNYNSGDSFKDGVAHMIEEIPNPSVVGPKIMIGCVGIGTFTGTIFLIVLLFVAGNIYEDINSAATPLLQIFVNATSNNAGAICLLV